MQNYYDVIETLAGLNLQNIDDNAYQRNDNHGIGINVKVLIQHAIQCKVK